MSNDNSHHSLSCRYDVYGPDRRVVATVTGWVASRRHGREVWDHYGESIDHSPWCNRPACVRARAVVFGVPMPSDPLLVGTTPEPAPF